MLCCSKAPRQQSPELFAHGLKKNQKKPKNPTKHTPKTRLMYLLPTTRYPDDLMHLEMGIHSATRSFFKAMCLPRQGSSPWWCFSLTDHIFPLFLWTLVSSKTRLSPQRMNNLPRGRLGSWRPACYCQLLHIAQSCASFLFFFFFFGTNRDT